jgi:hypothetical protein
VSYFLSDHEKLQYKNDGYILRENQFSSTEIDIFRNFFETTVSKAHSIAGEGKEYFLDEKRFVDIDYLTLQFEPEPHEDFLKVIEPAHSLNSDLEKIIADRKLTDPIRSILSLDEVSLWTDKLNLKRPKIGSGFGWHQDSPYWIHDSEDVDTLPNVYICLDDADDIDDAVDLIASAGSLIFFNQHIVHGSKPNQSNQERRAYIVTYQPKNRAMLKSGEVKNI